ncbi:uncharacterized protein LOC135216358 [Macrobrachium nipponense]|uniref:uncharacterized protein LOC135216358 n=1 Tax=Macrobrachium nipponense TaxID=159736 RepID=UPI0030C8155B
MAAVDVPLSPVMGSPAFSPVMLDYDPKSLLSRKRRMNFYDLANLLDSDGNLQNEMLVFAFAATMLSTIPVLLGNEFDVNVGLRKRRDVPEEPDIYPYVAYSAPADNAQPDFYTSYTYEKIMTSPITKNDGVVHSHTDESGTVKKDLQKTQFQDTAVAGDDMGHLLRELLEWSHEKVKNKPLLPVLVNLALDRYHGYSNPADKLVKTAYKKWKNFTW